MPRVFAKDERREKALTRENARLKRIVGDLTVKLKKPKNGCDKAEIIRVEGNAKFSHF
jgi:hypothetical protein